MKVIRLAILGLGNVPLALLRYVQEPGPASTLREAGIAIKLTGITTGSRGNAIDEQGIALAELEKVGKTGLVSDLNRGPKTKNNLEFIAAVPADILFVATPAHVSSLEEIKAAFARRISVVTSNKTPVATHFRELASLAQKQGVGYEFSATVLAGWPPWRRFLESITKPQITEILAVVNATSNQILTMMLEEGKSFAEGIKKAQEQGIAERDPGDDIDGHDTQKKIVILANTLMDADLTPADVPTSGIRDITLEQLQKADREGKWVQLMGRAWRNSEGKVLAEVKPIVTDHSMFARLRGTDMGLWFEIPSAGPFGIPMKLPEGDKAIMATAAGVFEDILTIARTGLQG